MDHRVMGLGGGGGHRNTMKGIYWLCNVTSMDYQVNYRTCHICYYSKISAAYILVLLQQRLWTQPTTRQCCHQHWHMEQSNNTSWQQKGFCCSTKHVEANPLHLSTVTKLGDLNQLFRFPEQSASHRWPWPLYGRWYICLSSSSFFLAFCHSHRHWVQAKWAMLNRIDNTFSGPLSWIQLWPFPVCSHWVQAKWAMLNRIDNTFSGPLSWIQLWPFPVSNHYDSSNMLKQNCLLCSGTRTFPTNKPWELLVSTLFPHPPTPHTHMWFSKVQFPVFVWPEFYTILSNPEL